jgi:phospholipase C
MPGFTDVALDGEMGNLQPGTNFNAQATAGTLPAVSWVIPPFTASDHPAADIARGQAWLQKVVSEVQAGPDWPTSAIFIQWDEYGGFYDHVTPPVVDGLGYGFRVPLIIVSPLVKRSFIDHQLLSSDAELKLIEDLFCGSQRLDSTDGRPDSRPDVRENYLPLGDLKNDFLSQPPPP